MNTADSLIFQTEKQLNEFGDKVPADKKTEIEGALNELKEAHKNKEMSQIDNAISKLNETWQKASEEMYKNTSEEAQSEPETVDVDFEEVKK